MRELRRAFGDRVNVRIEPGSYIGIFDVLADGELIFSKKDEHRFPTLEDIKSRLERKP